MEVKPSITMNKNGMRIMIGICVEFLKVNFNDYFSFPIKFGYCELIFAIIPSVSISACIQTGFELDWKKGEYMLSIDVCGKAETSVSLDAGLYVPSSKSLVAISLHIGIHGIIGSGEVGIKLSLFLTEDKFMIDLYSKIKAFEFSFYLLIRIEINFKTLKFLKIFKLENISFEFYIFSHTFLCLVKYENHLERTYKYNRQLISKRNYGNFSMKLDFYFWNKTLKKS